VSLTARKEENVKKEKTVQFCSRTLILQVHSVVRGFRSQRGGYPVLPIVSLFASRNG
jgi:hypothetical protein